MAPTSSQLMADPIGCYPQATVACFDPTCGDLPRRQLDEGLTIRFLEGLAAAGAPALLIAASTGHGHVRTVDELAQWYRCAAEANVGAATRMALLRPEDGEAANARLLDLLVELAYPVVFVRPGTGLPADADDERVADNLHPVVRAAAERGLAVGVYSIPDVSGVALSDAATAMLLDRPGGDHIVAAKITEADYEQSTLRFLANPSLSHLKIVQGWDPHLARALRDGPQFDQQGRERCGVTSGPMSLAVFQYMNILAAATRGDWEEVAMAQQAVTSLFAAMQDDPNKFADLQRAKYVMGLGQPLTGTVTEEQVDRLLAALRGLARADDRRRLARSLDLLGDGPFHAELARLSE
jgi:dihydrodipicolinate synthase/N-acetylneuraminate lyase